MVGVKEQTLLMLETKYILALGVNTMPADAVAPKVVRPTRKHWNENFNKHANGLVQNCGISIANVPEIPQSCTGPLIPANEFHCKNITHNFVAKSCLQLFRASKS